MDENRINIIKDIIKNTDILKHELFVAFIEVSKMTRLKDSAVQCWEASLDSKYSKGELKIYIDVIKTSDGKLPETEVITDEIYAKRTPDKWDTEPSDWHNNIYSMSYIRDIVILALTNNVEELPIEALLKLDNYFELTKSRVIG